MLSGVTFGSGEQLLAVRQRGAHPPMTGAQLHLGGVDATPGWHPKGMNAPLCQQPVQ